MKTKVLRVLIPLLCLMVGLVFSSQGEAPPRMVLVKGGTFMMGEEDPYQYMGPIHTVTVDSFCIGKFEVTQAEWQAIMGDNPSFYKGDNNPAEQVSWLEIIEYCNKRSEKEGLTLCYSKIGENIVCDFTAVGYRLPCEVEWEFACIGGEKSNNYFFSGSNDVGEVAWYEGNSGGKPHAVGGKKPNELGIYDMNGNVWEWCWDWYDEDYYKKSPAENPRGPEKGKARTYRGGGCSGVKHYQLARHRDGLEPTYKESDMGFRLAKTIGPKGKIPGNMIPVKGGTFQMGSKGGYLGTDPVHKVILNSFYMGKYEITQEEFARVMGYNVSWYAAANNAADCVRWYEAVEYCNKRSEMEGLTPCYSGEGNNITCNFAANGYRLPTEAEWEYAGRGGALSKNYKFSGSNDPEKVAWFDKNLTLDRRVRRVGMKQPNELGIYDMTGNTWEWCWDRYQRDYFNVSPQDNPKGPTSGVRRVIRGGNAYIKPLSPTYRSHLLPIVGWRGYGFRVVRSIN
jgi:sulfatase modifying factor 1